MLARLRNAQDKKDSGFTLIELLVVMIIIGILAAIAVPVFLNQRKKGWDSQAQSDLRNIATAQETYFADAGNYAIPADANALTSTLNAKLSSTVVYTKTVGYTDNGVTSTTDATKAVGGFCVEVKSKSGDSFSYKSSGAGVSKTTC
jgi:type IV pilus assembly protein PilA